jgi:hypothetical protein
MMSFLAVVEWKETSAILKMTMIKIYESLLGRMEWVSAKPSRK